MPFLMAYSTPEKYIQWHRAHQKMQKNGIEHIKKYNLWHRAQILIFNGNFLPKQAGPIPSPVSVCYRDLAAAQQQDESPPAGGGPAG
jgi:uncharacterized protein YciI